jgi:hypothetical protein
MLPHPSWRRTEDYEPQINFDQPIVVTPIIGNCADGRITGE